MTYLHSSQTAALAHIERKALAERLSTRERVAAVLMRSATPMSAFDTAMDAVARRAPIDISFHPDRLDAKGQAVAAALLQTGLYKNQFETGISNGGLTAFEGGERDNWEKRLFDGAYQQAGVVAAHRPKYGALNLLGHWDGACPRFGCCYFRLKPHVAKRSTFTYGDSVTEPNDMGTIDALDSVLAAVLEDVDRKGRALGGRNLTVTALLQHLAQQTTDDSSVDFSGPPGRSLDESIEVQVHGPVHFSSDVEYLVADQAFQNTQTGSDLAALSAKYGFAVHWHPGFTLPVSMIPTDFRGPVMGPLAQLICPDGALDVVKIGRAAVELRRNADIFSEWGTVDEMLQYLKQLWHVLATFGKVGPTPKKAAFAATY